MAIFTSIAPGHTDQFARRDRMGLLSRTRLQPRIVGIRLVISHRRLTCFDPSSLFASVMNRAREQRGSGGYDMNDAKAWQRRVYSGVVCYTAFISTIDPQYSGPSHRSTSVPCFHARSAQPRHTKHTACGNTIMSLSTRALLSI